MNGKISIHRWTGNQEGRTEGWTIALTDEDTGIQVFEVDLDMLEFSQAIGGLSQRPCTYTTRGLEYIGKKREVKTEEVYVPWNGTYKRDLQVEQAKVACAPFEIDGWKARYEDALNGNKIVRGSSGKDGAMYSVTFTRYVAKDPD